MCKGIPEDVIGEGMELQRGSREPPTHTEPYGFDFI